MKETDMSIGGLGVLVVPEPHCLAKMEKSRGHSQKDYAVM